MSKLLGLYTSDPYLVRCELQRATAEVTAAGADEAVGVGAYEDDVVLSRRYGPGVGRRELWAVPESDAVLMHAQTLALGASVEDETQPFRYRQWLFAQVGEVEGASQVRERVMAQVPDFLARNVRGAGLGEAVFALFLKSLRDLGRLDDLQLEASLVAVMLNKTARQVAQLATEAGAAHRGTLNCAATNGRLLVATRRGPQPLFYKLLEGEGTCDRCGIDGSGKDSDSLVREHRRRRSIVVSSEVAKPNGWLELADGASIAVDRKLNLQLLPGN
ncbi:MAG: class II glutamine amidotransferase [Myxococcaceae bacterium]|nr:class II glutamine amidotransferase [Myxococcaceae bacterium]